jgi:hypothetical protein
MRFVEARQNEASPVPVRLFARADEKGALEWAAAARRGE